MPEYTPTKIGIGPQSTGFGVPEYNITARKNGFAQDVDFNSSFTVPRIGMDATLSPSRVRVFQDFLQDAGATLPTPWGKQDTSAAGSPTTDFVADTANGVYRLKHDSQSEAQNLTLYFADQLVIDPTKKPIFECRLKIDFAGAAFSADQRIVIGLASARDATLDSIVSNVWFRIEGANLNILCEADDGTTDTDDIDTGYDIVDATYLTLRIDMTSLSDIKFYVDGKLSTYSTAIAASALAASNLLQPYIEIQRDAGTETEDVIVDYILVDYDRT